LNKDPRNSPKGGRESKRRDTKEREYKTNHMQVKVLFFGVLSEVAGSDCKYYSDTRSSDDLRHRILDDFPEIVHYNYRLSLNNEIIESNMPLGDNDEVALLPPFAGG
jgi:molybdopterin converting factor small subunit